MNDQIVSSQYGIAVGMTSDSIIFEMNSAWHVHLKRFKNSKKILRRSGDTLLHDVFNYDALGVCELSIEESYKVDSNSNQ